MYPQHSPDHLQTCGVQALPSSSETGKLDLFLPLSLCLTVTEDLPSESQNIPNAIWLEVL